MVKTYLLIIPEVMTSENKHWKSVVVSVLQSIRNTRISICGDCEYAREQTPVLCLPNGFWDAVKSLLTAKVKFFWSTQLKAGSNERKIKELPQNFPTFVKILKLKEGKYFRLERKSSGIFDLVSGFLLAVLTNGRLWPKSGLWGLFFLYKGKEKH